MNEPDGSSKLAIARYIERWNTNLPPAHGSLMSHHLKSLKNSGILTVVKKSYKLIRSSPPHSVAIGAAAVATGLAAPRSVFPMAITGPWNSLGLKSEAIDDLPKPKPKPSQQQQPINVQKISQKPIDVQPISQQPINIQPNAVPSNGLPSEVQSELPVKIVKEYAYTRIKLFQ